MDGTVQQAISDDMMPRGDAAGVFLVIWGEDDAFWRVCGAAKSGWSWLFAD